MFPQFWIALQEEINEHPEDLIHTKSILTVLGFTTKKSIASLKTAKKVANLEGEYIKMRATGAEAMNHRFPSLSVIEAFTPGIKSIINDIAIHLSPRPKDFPEEDIETVRTNVLKELKEVCCCVCC